MNQIDFEKIVDSKIVGDVFTSALSLWFNISVISLVLVIMASLLLLSGKSHCHYCYLTVFSINLFLFLIVQFYCLRLHIDKHLFEKLYHAVNEDIDKFDATLEFIFCVKKHNTPLSSRLIGTRHLLKMSFISLIMQIICLIGTAIYCIH